MRTLLIALALLVHGAGAVAQSQLAGHRLPAIEPPPDINDRLQPDYARRDLAIIAEGLGLDPSQQHELEAIHRRYEQTVREGMEPVRAAVLDLAAARLEQDAADLALRDRVQREMAELLAEQSRRMAEPVDEDERQDAAALFAERAALLQEQLEGVADLQPLIDRRRTLDSRLDEWRDLRARTKGRFEDELLATLREEQVERWPATQRLLLRRGELGRGRLSGESVNLLEAVGALELDSQAAERVAPLLESYELELHEALRRRVETIEQSSRELARSPDAAETARLVRQQVAAHQGVRDLHARLLETIAAELPAGEAERLRAGVMRLGFPRVFQSTAADRRLSAALELEDLTTDQRAALVELQQEYRTQLTAMNQDLVERLRRDEPLRLEQHLLQRWLAGDPTGRPERDPSVDEAFQRRLELATPVNEQLHEILNEAQIQSLP